MLVWIFALLLSLIGSELENRESELGNPLILGETPPIPWDPGLIPGEVPRVDDSVAEDDLADQNSPVQEEGPLGDRSVEGQSAGNLPSNSVRVVPFGGRHLPLYQPAWCPAHPLEQVAELLQGGDLLQATETLARLVDELQGHLLPPADVDSSDPWSQLGDAGDQIADWLRTQPGFNPALPPPSEEIPWPESPLFWHPGWRDAAADYCDAALEDGRFLEAARILGSPNRPRGVSEAATRWLLGPAIADERLATGFPKSAGGSPQPSGQAQPRLPDQLRQIYRLPLQRFRREGRNEVIVELLPTPADSFLWARKVKSRRLPLNELYPLVLEDRVVMEVGSRIFAVSTEGLPRLLWEQRGADGLGKDRASLLLHLHEPAGAGDVLAFALRTDIPQHPQALMGLHGSKKQFGIEMERSSYNRIALLTGAEDGGLPQPMSHLSSEVARLTEGWTITGPPVILQDRLYLLLARGWRQIRFQVVAFDLPTGDLLWTRFLGGVDTLHSFDDFRGVHRRGRLIPLDTDLVVVHDAGWVTRIDRASGGLRGALCYPRYTLEDTPHQRSGFAMIGIQLKDFPAPRPRYFGPHLEHESHGRKILVVLPPDAQQLIAVDCDRWEQEWRSDSVTATTMLLGRVGDLAILLDCGIPAGESHLTLLAIDLETGIEHSRQRLELSVENAHDKVGGELRSAPLLVGVPRLCGHEVWIPSLAGLEVWDLQALSTEASRVVSWPAGSFGGTPIPLPGGRLLTITRGDKELQRPSVLEIFE